MRPLIRAIVTGAAGYLLGAGVTASLTGHSLAAGLPVTIGYVLGLAGWLLGIGVWGAWVREWLGLEARPDTGNDRRRYFRFCTDHKVIGVQYLVTFVTVLLIGGLLAMVMRIELAAPGKAFLDSGRYNEIMSLHGILMVAVAVAGTLGSFGNYFVPLMIGANDMAFPRINALSFWLVPPVAIALLASPALGGFDSGWTAYPPLSVVNADGQILFNLAVMTFGISSILGGLNILTTVITMRAKGMDWGRLPIFVWSAFAASILSLVITQFFAASLLLVLLDRIAGTTFFGAKSGGDPLLYQHLFWFYSHPAVYIMVLPGFGAMLEIVTHLSRKPLFGYRLVVGAFMSIVGLSVVVWAHHMFTSGMANYLHAPFMALTELISIPTGVVFLAAIGTLWQGKLWLRAPLLFAMGQIFNFLIGGITGIFLADVATDVQLHDTYFVVAHFHYTIVGGAIFAFMAGIYYWFPKVTGRMYNERMGQLHAIWMTVAFNATFLPLFWVGINGMNRRVADYPAELSGANRFATIAALILGLGFVPFVFNMLYSAFRGAPACANPWAARTLEWEVSSPPPEHNFLLVPEIVGHPYEYGVAEARHLAPASTEPTASAT